MHTGSGTMCMCDDLISLGFKKEKSEKELLKPKNMFDLVTKGKNKQISYYKNKWNDSMWKLDHELKKKIKTEIVRIEEESVKLICLVLAGVDSHRALNVKLLNSFK